MINVIAVLIGTLFGAFVGFIVCAILTAGRRDELEEENQQLRKRADMIRELIKKVQYGTFFSLNKFINELLKILDEGDN